MVRIGKDGDMEFQFWAPWELCGAIIGDKGAGIRKLRDTHRMHLEVEFGDAGDSKRHRAITMGPAPPGTIRDAIADCFDLFMMDREPTANPVQQYKECTFSIALSHNEIGALIGRKGETANLIRQETGCKLTILKDDGEWAAAPTKPEEEYTSGYVEVFGVLLNLKVAFEMLVKAVCQPAQLKFRREKLKSQSRGGGGGRGGGGPRGRSRSPPKRKSKSRRRSRSRGRKSRSRSRGRKSRSRGRRSRSRSRSRSRRR